MARPLTHKQSLFVVYYIGEAKGNATEAAALAGYAGNRKTLQKMGEENLAKPLVKKAIALQQKAMMSKIGVTRETIQKMYDETYTLAENLGHSQTMRGCADSMAKMYGLNEERDKDQSTAPVNIQLNFNGRSEIPDA